MILLIGGCWVVWSDVDFTMVFMFVVLLILQLIGLLLVLFAMV